MCFCPLFPVLSEINFTVFLYCWQLVGFPAAGCLLWLWTLILIFYLVFFSPCFPALFSFDYVPVINYHKSDSEPGADLCLIDPWSTDSVPSRDLKSSPFPPVSFGYLDALVPSGNPAPPMFPLAHWCCSAPWPFSSVSVFPSTSSS